MEYNRIIYINMLVMKYILSEGFTILTLSLFLPL